MITKVEKWEHDGRFYDTKEQAEYARNIDDIGAYMDEHPLHVSTKGPVKSQQVLLWLRMSCPRIHMQLLPETAPQADKSSIGKGT